MTVRILRSEKVFASKIIHIYGEEIMISSKPLKASVVVLDGLNASHTDTFEKWLIYSLLCASFAYCARRTIFG